MADQEGMPSHKCLMFGWRGAQIETIYLGDRKLSVRTSVLEEKATACNMLCCYADELKEGFYPFVEQVRTDSTSCLHATFLTCFAYSIHHKLQPSNYAAMGRCQKADVPFCCQPCHAAGLQRAQVQHVLASKHAPEGEVSVIKMCPSIVKPSTSCPHHR